MAADCNQVGWFEIPVTDMQRAKSFYENILQITLQLRNVNAVEMAWFPMRADATGSAGSLVKGAGYVPSANGVLIYFTTPDIDAVLDRVAASGGKVISRKTGIGEYGSVGFFCDSEGNRIALHARA
jgi:predicted enzyme related to lactoylglutathione lyase